MTMYPDQEPGTTRRLELEAGPDHVLVLYLPADISSELDPVAIFSEIAAMPTSGHRPASECCR